MDAHPSFGSPSFKLVAKGLVALHRLTGDGKEDSPEADSVRDALDRPLKVLSRVEKERAQWLSEDLYSVSEPAASDAPTAMNPQAQQEFNEAIEARQNREWDRALTLLRQCKDSVSPALLSYLRGSIWLEAGHPEIASVFYGHASRLEPTNARYRAIYLRCLADAEPETATRLATEVLADDQKHAPLVVAQAADIRFKDAKAVATDESARLYRELIPILERNMTRIERDEDTPSRVSAYARTAGLLGFCHEFLGHVAEAVNDYTRGLSLKPDDDALLLARGMILYGASPRAVTDLEQAVRLGSPVVWPYLFLAHHYLASRQYNQCIFMCEEGLRKRGTNTAKSQLQDWLAIARAELGFPPELVEAAFEAALRLDPSNELARRNQEAFEASLRVHRRTRETSWQQRSEAEVRQFGLAEQRAA